MVLLELLRGSIGSITAANIDLIIGENSAVVTDSSETKHEEDGHRIERTESRVRRESTAHAEQELSEDAAKLRFKKAHQFHIFKVLKKCCFSKFPACPIYFT